MRDLLLCMAAAMAVGATALARWVVALRRRAAREEPVLRCIRELRWEGSWPAAAYCERLAKRLQAQLGIGARGTAARRRGRADLSFDYQGTTWFIAVEDRLQSLKPTQVEHDIAELFVECAERRAERPTVAVVVGVPNGAAQDSAHLRFLRAALVGRAARPASSDVNLEVVAVPLGRGSIPPGASAGA